MEGVYRIWQCIIEEVKGQTTFNNRKAGQLKTANTIWSTLTV